MARTLALVALVLALLPSGERIVPLHREGAEFTCSESSSLEMTLDEAFFTVNGERVPMDPGMTGFSDRGEEREIRFHDTLLEVSDGRPARVRRTFEHLRRTTEQGGEPHEEVGVLEDRSIVIVADDDGEDGVELESGEAVEGPFLERHRVAWSGECLLPSGEVKIGDTWRPEGDELRRFAGVATGPRLFEGLEDGQDEAFDERMEEASDVSATVELTGFEERDGLRCAVLTFSVTVEADVDESEDPTAEPDEEIEDFSAGTRMELEFRGKLWFAVDEGRPVALEQTAEGTMEIHFGGTVHEDGQEIRVETRVTSTIAGEREARWD